MAAAGISASLLCLWTGDLCDQAAGCRQVRQGLSPPTLGGACSSRGSRLLCMPLSPDCRPDGFRAYLRPRNLPVYSNPVIMSTGQHLQQQGQQIALRAAVCQAAAGFGQQVACRIQGPLQGCSSCVIVHRPVAAALQVSPKSGCRLEADSHSLRCSGGHIEQACTARPTRLQL